MSDDRKDLPPVNAPNFLEKVRELLGVYLGNRGDKLDRGVTLRDLSDAGLVTLSPRYTGGVGGSRVSPISGAGTSISGVYEPDLTPPPTPSGFTATAAISNLMLSCNAQTYTQGHGHAKSVLYGATWVSGALPVFANAVVLTEFSGTFFAHATNPATTWHLWLKWVTVDGVYSTSPAGGTNGVVVTTGQNVSTLLTALTGQITAGQLYTALGDRINLIDGASNLAGSVNARVLAEATARGTAITNEANLRTTGDAQIAGTVSTLAARVTTNEGNISTNTAAITTEQTARANGDSANASSISTLSAQVNHATTGLPAAYAAVQTEATTRATADGTLFAQYTVKLDVNGYVSGYGLASTATNAAPTSTFAVRADSFYIASPSGPGVSPTMPFIVRTTQTTINGVVVPVGVYMTDAYIQNGTITNVKIGNAAIDDAKVANLSASKLTAGSIAVGQYIQSTSYVAGSAGWRINGSGLAEFSDVVVRGTVYANAGLIGGNSISSSGISSPDYTGNQGVGGAGWVVASNGSAFFGSVKVRGEINVGNFDGYAWPASGGGAHLSASGLALGNGNTSSYFLVTSAGNITAPQFSITGGNATFAGALSAASGTFSGSLTASAINAVNTINIAGNAVTVPVAARSYGAYYFGPADSSYRETTVMTTTLSGTQGQPVWIHVNCGAFSSDDAALVAPAVIKLVVDGTNVLQNDAATPNRLNSGYYMASSPAYSFTIAVVVGGYGSSISISQPGVYPNAALFAIAAKR